MSKDLLQRAKSIWLVPENKQIKKALSLLLFEVVPTGAASFFEILLYNTKLLVYYLTITPIRQRSEQNDHRGAGAYTDHPYGS